MTRKLVTDSIAVDVGSAEHVKVGEGFDEDERATSMAEHARSDRSSLVSS